MRRAIVTGANGFLGRNLCKKLSEDGVEVYAVVRDAEGADENVRVLNGIRVIRCEMSDYFSLADAVPRGTVDTFYHFAWTGIAGSERAIPSLQLKNIEHSINAMEVAAKIGCERFVFPGSIMEYEIAAVINADRTPPENAIYSIAKQAADYMLDTCSYVWGIDYVRMIISNIYGPGENSPRLINTSLKKMLKKEHCEFSDGTQLYDFIYIDDAVRAFVLLGDKGRAGSTYYIGSESPKPLKDFLFELRDCVDPSIEIGIGELRNPAISLSYNEFKRNALFEELGFRTEVSFSEGIRRTIEWMKSVSGDVG